MLKYEKLSPRDARRAWPQIVPNAVACETQVRDIEKAGINEFPHLSVDGKRTVRCLYSPSEQRILLERGVHVLGSISEANGSGASKSPFPGFFMVRAVPSPQPAAL